MMRYLVSSILSMVLLGACSDSRSPCEKAGAKARALIKRHPKARELTFMMGDGSIYENACRRHTPSQAQFQCMNGASSLEEFAACVPDLVARYLQAEGPMDPPDDAARNPPPAPRPRGVASDCYEDGLICDKTRIADAERAAAVLEATLAQGGWPAGCFEIQYIAGDDNEADAISIGVNGPGGRSETECGESSDGRADRKKLSKLGAHAKRVLAQNDALLDNVDLIQVTDGHSDVHTPIGRDAH